MFLYRGSIAFRKAFVADDCATEDVAVPAQALRNAVDDDVDAVLYGALEVGGHECVVRHRRYTPLLRYLGDRLHVGELHHRVRRRLDVDELRVGLDRLLDGGEVTRVDESALYAVPLEDVSEDLVGTPVEGVACEDVVALLARPPSWQSEMAAIPEAVTLAVLTSLESCYALLERSHSRVTESAVDVAWSPYPANLAAPCSALWKTNVDEA